MNSPEINGIKYLIYNKEDCIQSCLNAGDQWNSEIIDIIKSYISTKTLSHFLNVGSHIGTVSLPISLHINKVTAIEAYPETHKYLCENITLNNISNIQTYNVALGNSKETIYFMGMDKLCPVENINRIKNNTGGMHVFTADDINNNTRSSILCDKNVKNEMNSLDELDVDTFDIMLVDIEGSEYNFLLGAQAKIKKNKPIIIIEIWDDHKRAKENMKISQKTVINYIISLNYKLVRTIGEDFIFEPL
jgi:FkbM family methyltransferase